MTNTTLLPFQPDAMTCTRCSGSSVPHIELYIRHLGDSVLRVPPVNTMTHGRSRVLPVRHIDGLIPANPAVYARLPKIHCDESRTQGLERLELIRFLQVAQTLTVHHGALALPARHLCPARLRGCRGLRIEPPCR